MSDLYEPSHTHPRTPVIKPEHIAAVLSSAGPEQVTTERRVAKTINVSGKKSNTTSNTDTIWVGLSPDYQPWQVPSGQTMPISNENGFPIDTADLYMRGTSGDGVILEFTEGPKA
jgi:hypothetical protein